MNKPRLSSWDLCTELGKAQWCRPMILALENLRQEPHKSKSSLTYIVRPFLTQQTKTIKKQNTQLH